MRKHIESLRIIPCSAPTSKLFKNLTGQRFGRLLVQSLYGIRKIHYYYTCLCDCGKSKTISGSSMKRGYTRSCGCFRSETAHFHFQPTTHGMSGTRIYNKWIAMRYRCTQSNCKAYKNYGGRGLKVCERWLHSFEHFYADMGDCPSRLTLERRNNDLGYNPDNCYLGTTKQQTRNQRTNRIITFNGLTMCVADWEVRLGFRKGTVWARMNLLRWTEEMALSRPVRKKS